MTGIKLLFICYNCTNEHRETHPHERWYRELLGNLGDLLDHRDKTKHQVDVFLEEEYDDD